MNTWKISIFIAQSVGAVEYTNCNSAGGSLFGFYGMSTFIGYLMPNSVVYV